MGGTPVTTMTMPDRTSQLLTGRVASIGTGTVDVDVAGSTLTAVLIDGTVMEADDRVTLLREGRRLVALTASPPQVTFVGASYGWGPDYGEASGQPLLAPYPTGTRPGDLAVFTYAGGGTPFPVIPDDWPQMDTSSAGQVYKPGFWSHTVEASEGGLTYDAGVAGFDAWSMVVFRGGVPTGFVGRAAGNDYEMYPATPAAGGVVAWLWAGAHFNLGTIDLSAPTLPTGFTTLVDAATVNSGRASLIIVGDRGVAWPGSLAYTVTAVPDSSTFTYGGGIVVDPA